MARPPKHPMSAELKQWLNQTVYPKLAHDQVFGTLPNYTKAEYSETRYSDCPRCHHRGTFYMLDGRQIGRCSSCNVTIPWFSFLRYDHTIDEAIIQIADFAGVKPLPRLADDLPTDSIFRV